MSGSNQLRRVRAAPSFNVVAGDIGSFLEDSTLRGDGSFTVLVRTFPNN
jgi:hypothetical protein